MWERELGLGQRSKEIGLVGVEGWSWTRLDRNWGAGARGEEVGGGGGAGWVGEGGLGAAGAIRKLRFVLLLDPVFELRIIWEPCMYVTRR